MTPEFWKNKKVLLTGHTGFKGSWLTLWLGAMGAKVQGFALEPNGAPNLFDVADVSSVAQSTFGDIQDYQLVEKLVTEFEPDIIIHMAAQALVRYSYANPIETYGVNVMGSVHILEAARKAASVKAILNITSDKCYDNKEHKNGYIETDPMGGFDPYSSSKGAAELVTAAYRNSYFPPQKYSEHGVAVASARAGNVIGGGDWAQDRLIPDIIRAIEKGEKVDIRAPGSVRPWQHVLEPLHGYLCLIEKMYEDGAQFADAWNFGPFEKETCTVGQIVEKFVNMWGDGASWSATPSRELHEANYLYLDASKARQKLDWSPTLTLDQTLEQIVFWHKAYDNQQNMNEVTTNQISDFQDLILKLERA